MGKVSVARDEPLKREVALKELLDSTAESPGSRERFVEEAEITAQLEHPGVVPVYALGMDRQGRPFYTMRLVHGKTLKEAIAEHHESRDPGGLRDLVRRFVMVCQTIAYAHTRGVIHRDIKPSNIILGPFGETLVMDWGVAKPVAEGQSPDSTLGDLAQQLLPERPEVTAPGQLLGTPPYMSPEQAAGKTGEIGPASDIYTLGAVLYQLLTGTPPYSGGSSGEIIGKIKFSPPPAPSTSRPGVPRALEAICLKAMAREPADRYPDAAALAHDLQNWLDDQPVSAFREPLAERVFRWARRHKALVTSVVVSVVCLTVALSIGTVIIVRERARALAAEQLAEDYAQQAADAQRQAEEKEAEAAGLAEEAEKARAEAGDAAQKAAEASQQATEAKTRIARLDAELKVKAAEASELKQRIEQDRAALTAAEVRAAAETERARGAEQKAESLDRDVAALRREADELRALARQLGQLAGALKNPPQPLSISAVAPWEDFTEQPADSFAVTCSDGAPCVPSSDTTRAFSGLQSLRVRVRGGTEAWVTYPREQNANWDLSKYDRLTLAFLAEGPGATPAPTGLKIRIGRGAHSIEYQLNPSVLAQFPKQWRRFAVPLCGDWPGSRWGRSDVGTLDLSHVDWVAVQVSAEKTGFQLWLDDVGFGPDTRRAPPLASEPNRRAAESVLAINGTLRVSVPGKEIEVNTLGDLPRERFAVTFVNVDNLGLVTDDWLRNLEGLNECRMLYIAGTRMTDRGFEHLASLRKLEWLGLFSARISGEGFKYLGRLENLWILWLHGAQVTDEGLESVRHLKALQVLELLGTRVSGSFLRHCADLPNFRELRLTSSKLNDNGMRHLGKLTRLKKLLIDGTEVTDEGLKSLEGLTALEDLHFGRGRAVTPAALAPLKHLTNLQSLSIYAPQVSGEGLKQLAGLPIVHLGFNGLETLDDNGMEALGRLPKLKGLYFPGSQISDTPFRKLPNLRGLERLDLNQSARITDATLEHVAALKTLGSIVLNGTGVSTAGVIKLQAALPKCQISVDPNFQKALDEMRKKKQP